MEESKGGGLTERVGLLEAEVEAQGRELRGVIRRLDRLTAGMSGALEEAPVREGRPDPVAAKPAAAGGDGGLREIGVPFGLEGLRSGEWWLNKIGIGLLLFGAAFLFKFSVDQNWITPSVRVGIGLGLGALLVLLGLRVYADRRAFSQVLLGGGIGVFYITGYAAFQLYGLVPYAAAFAFMVSVTSLALFLSVYQDGAALALIGTAGGLGTPFILYVGAGSVGGLVLYTSLILAGACAIYAYRGWTSLLLTACGGTWAVFLIGYSDLLYWNAAASTQDRLAMQIGIVCAWVVLWISASGREVLRAREPRRWPRPEPGVLTRTLFSEDVLRSTVPAHAISAATPLAALWFTELVWNLDGVALGGISLAAAALYAGAAILVRSVENGGRVHRAQALTALLLATLALVLLLDGNPLLVALALEAAVLHHLSRRVRERALSAGAHALSLGVLGWVFLRILDGALVVVLGSSEPSSARGVPFFGGDSLAELAGISLVLAASVAIEHPKAALAYRVAVHAALLAWLWQGLSPLPNGAAYTTIAWGLYAAGLLVAGLRLDAPSLIRTGMATLFLVVGKLFLVDLAGVEAVWRILLFLGFGGLFLVLSYYLQHLWKPEAAGERSSVTAGYLQDEELRKR
ncbi:MAG: DUF2339 domain-containing protein [Actinomycetota bacterium]|nr:DUF2339 domain-containing protein [Actinomycetota bacterium]MDP9484833.1 DUF2339 domain-containing protein [Actinomycetota bacterium]